MNKRLKGNLHAKLAGMPEQTFAQNKKKKSLQQKKKMQQDQQREDARTLKEMTLETSQNPFANRKHTVNYDEEEDDVF